MPLLRDVDYVLQVGDLGMDYSYLRRVLTKDKISCSRFLAGNHDCYQEDSPEYFRKQPFFLGDYGVHTVGTLNIFYVRGAWSIDHKRRQEEKPPSWWEEEELTLEQGDQALELYKELKPDFVVTHECPQSLVRFVTNPDFCLRFGYAPGTITTRTNSLLQLMLDFHRPLVHIFGHYHTRWESEIDGTKFICLDMANMVTVRYPSDPSACYIDFEV